MLTPPLFWPSIPLKLKKIVSFFSSFSNQTFGELTFIAHIMLTILALNNLWRTHITALFVILYYVLLVLQESYVIKYDSLSNVSMHIIHILIKTTII
jgi:hypothetical protein